MKSDVPLCSECWFTYMSDPTLGCFRGIVEGDPPTCADVRADETRCGREEKESGM